MVENPNLYKFLQTNIITMTKEEINDVTEMDLIYESHDKIDALIELLVKKGVFEQHEYNQQLEELIERLEGN